MFGGMTPDRPVSQPSLPPLESPYLVNSSSRSISYFKSPSPNDRTQLYKLQEQLKTMQDELQRKDKLIDQMSKLEMKNCPDKYTDSKLSIRSVCLEREDVAALNVKLEDLRTQLSEVTTELHQKDTATESLKQTNSRLREEIARLQVAIENSNQEISEFRDTKEAFETIRQRNNILIESLQNELVETQQHLLDCRVYGKQLEDQLANLATEKDEYQIQVTELKESIREVTCEDIQSLVGVSQMMKSLVFDRETLNNKVLSLEEKIKSRDCEQQASRQTITRLVAKLGVEENKSLVNDEKITSLQRELDQYLASKSLLESDINTFECQILSLKKEIEILTQDNNTKSKRIEDIMASSVINQRNDEQQQQINQFMKSVVSILSENYKTPNDDSISIYDWIIGCIRSLIKGKDDNSNILDTGLDSLEAECNDKGSNPDIDLHLKVKLEDLEDRLKKAEKDLINNAIIIDGLRCDKTKYYRTLSELARVMNMTDINKDIGFDMITEALYARAVQLQKMEYDMRTEQRLSDYSLSKKLKELKEKLNSKDLHIDLLHKKLTAYEGKQHNFDTVGKERDKELLSNKKLAKHNQKLQEELDNARQEIINLKASIVENGRLQVTAIAQEQDIKTLTAKLDKLELVRQKQSKLLNDYKMDQSNSEKAHQNAKAMAEEAINSLNNELRMVKESLNDCKRKEQQMADTRAVVAKLLGLDIDDLAIPDFEIINRLERLIAAHQSNVYTQFSLDSTLREMNEGLFHDPCVLHRHHVHTINEDPVYPKNKTNH